MPIDAHIANWPGWVERCAEVLRSNQIVSGGHRYTRPAPHVYEQQWLWDSCFHAIAYRHFDAGMARDELRALMAHQVGAGADAGMIPHMAYWDGTGEALWGHAERSIITQPPLIAVAAWLVYDSTGDDDFLRELYPGLLAYHDWFERRRDLNGDGLVAIIHPWESGWDASPRWDAAMGLHLPSDEDSKQARHGLVTTLRAHDCDARTLRDAGSFCVYPVDFNAIRAYDLLMLSKIAAVIGADDLHPRYERVRDAVVGAFAPHGSDINAADGKPTHIESAAQFVLALAADAFPLDALRADRFWPRYPVPTTPSDAPNYDGGHYWRGNVWLAVNWLIYTALRVHHQPETARELATRSLDLVDATGFYEYFNPQTGAGYGPSQQSWSTIVLDMLATEHEPG